MLQKLYTYFCFTVKGFLSTALVAVFLLQHVPSTVLSSFHDGHFDLKSCPMNCCDDGSCQLRKVCSLPAKSANPDQPNDFILKKCSTLEFDFSKPFAFTQIVLPSQTGNDYRFTDTDYSVILGSNPGSDYINGLLRPPKA